MDINSIQNKTFSLENKTVLITGAGSGLGRHFAHTCAKAGAFVILTGRNQESLAHVAQEIEALGGKAGCYCLDITHFDFINTHVNSIFERFIKIDILINNAGLTSKVKKEPFDYSIAEWDEVFNTNVKGVWILTNIVAKKMIDFQIQGSIINISSTNALRPRPTNALYCISKSTLNAMTENLAMEYAKYNIRVNAIAPGIIGVGMSKNINATTAGQELVQKRFPMGQVGDTSHLDGPLLLLCSDASKYMTGECLYVDGGLCTKAIM